MEQEAYTAIAQDLAQLEGVVQSQMFGKPCLKIEKKAFAAFQHEAMVFKLGREAIALTQEKYLGSVLWDPSGKERPMKDWLQVPADYIPDWPELAGQALTFVRAIK